MVSTTVSTERLGGGQITGSSDFSAAVLSDLGIAYSTAAVAALNAWQAAEGQWTARGSWNAAVNHNPLNLEGNTRGHPNPAVSVQYASPTNPINVYGDWATGVHETALRIQANPGIVAALSSASVTAATLSNAVSASGWGTGPFGGASGANQPGGPTAGIGGGATIPLTGGETSTSGGIPSLSIPGLPPIPLIGAGDLGPIDVTLTAYKGKDCPWYLQLVGRCPKDSGANKGPLPGPGQALKSAAKIVIGGLLIYVGFQLLRSSAGEVAQRFTPTVAPSRAATPRYPLAASGKGGGRRDARGTTPEKRTAARRRIVAANPAPPFEDEGEAA